MFGHLVPFLDQYFAKRLSERTLLLLFFSLLKFYFNYLNHFKCVLWKYKQVCRSSAVLNRNDSGIYILKFSIMLAINIRE